MRRLVAVAVVALFALGIGFAVMAQEQADTTATSSTIEQEKGMMETGKMKGMMKGKTMHRIKDKGANMMQPMMGMMMKKQMVATEDGGIIVLSGNKLLKYDKNLNLKNEVEIPMDMEGMQKRMKEMMKHCPMKMQEDEGAELEAQDIE